MPCKKCRILLTESNHNIWSNLCAECEIGLRFVEKLAGSFRHLFVLIRKRLMRQIFKKNHLMKLRADLVKESGGDISDEDWNKVIEKVENDYRKILEKELPKAFWLAMFETAEKSDCIIEIDGENLGEKLQYFRRLPSWLVQKKLYFGW